MCANFRSRDVPNPCYLSSCGLHSNLTTTDKARVGGVYYSRETSRVSTHVVSPGKLLHSNSPLIGTLSRPICVQTTDHVIFKMIRQDVDTCARRLALACIIFSVNQAIVDIGSGGTSQDIVDG